MTKKLTKKKKIWILVAALAVVLAAAVTAGAIFLPGLLRGNSDPNVKWYSEDQTEFVITTTQELYDLAYLSSKYDFEGQTIKLGADIVVNEGNAEAWGSTPPSRLWYPIDGFSGTFDGQGHTISGLYMNGFNADMGLFSNTSRHAVVQNLKVVNTYIKTSGEHGTGVIAANGAGTFDSIYTDAIIWSDNWNNGGIIGKVDANGDTAITNCWFDGQMILVSDQGRVAGGMVGDIMMESGVCTISHCLSTGTFSAEAATHTGRGRLMDIGGLVGRASTGTTNITDSFANTSIDSECVIGAGAAIGSAGKSTTNISHTYSAEEANVTSVGYRYNKTVGDTYVYPEETLVGYGAYKWTTLDFENYWAVVEDGTPILQTFADEIPSLEGVEREIDDSWYNKRTTYTISNYKQLLALHIISQWDNMSGKTIYLGDDIVIQEGDASEWRENAPEITWKGIGSANTMFAGIFDGLGHSVSGAYWKMPGSGIGFFRALGKGAVVRNFSLLNSYFESTNVAVNNQTYSYTGSIAAFAQGATLDTVYSNAIVVNDGYFAGGLVGLMRATGTSFITNSWFDGKIIMHGESGMRGGGIVGTVWNGVTLTVSHCLMTGEMTSDAWQWGANEGLVVGFPNEKCTLLIEDTLCAGTLTVRDGKKDGNGMIVGRISPAALSVTFDDVYAIKCEDPDITDEEGKPFYANWGLTGYRGIEPTCTGPAVILDAKYLTGYAAYQYTGLDFENYWAIDPDGHPILRAFMGEDEEAPDLSGYSKVVDYSWYSSAEDTYYISNRAQLMGLSMLASGDTFKDKTIYLTSNITINSGNAANWDNSAPYYEWIPIGNASVMFQGTFNGGGHTISGLYVSEPKNGLGLFGMVKNATIKNLRLTNSFVESTMCAESKAKGEYTNYNYIGSIAAYAANSTFSTIYSNAIVKNDGDFTGGLVGMANTKDNPVYFTNCWFDGTVIQDCSIPRKDGSLGSCYAGGIIGLVRNTSATLNHCLSTATMKAVNMPDGTWGSVAGGMVARVDKTGTNPGGTLTITDSLANITIEGYPSSIAGNGSVICQANPETYLKLDDVYAVGSAWKALATNRTAGTSGAIETVTLPRMTGANAYMWSDLDFDNYWVALEGKTPELKSFASGTAADPDDAYDDRVADTSWYSDEEDEFIITNTSELLGFAELSKTKDFAGKTVKLGADIAFNYGIAAPSLFETSVVAEGVDEWMPIGSTVMPFRGVFDGQGYTISGLANATGGQSALFAYVEDAFLQNVTIARSVFRGGSGGGKSAALVANTLGDTTIKRVKVESDVRLYAASHSGGIVAQNSGNLTMDNVWSAHYTNPQWVTTAYVGGIIGSNYNAAGVTLTLSNALYTGSMDGTVAGSGDGGSAIGGLLGSAGNDATTNISDSLSAGKITTLGVVSVNDRSSYGFFGSVIGNMSWKAGHTVISDVYGTTECFAVMEWDAENQVLVNTGEYHGLVRTNQSLGSGATQVKTADILGDKAKTNASGLDYENYWTTVAGKTPELMNPSSGEPTPDPITQPSNMPIDISWYNSTDTEFVLMDAADLNGFALLSQTNNFSGKTVKLGADITVNTGDASTWAETAPAYLWTPISTQSIPFKGTFDGQGYTISGLYMKDNQGDAGFGLVGCIEGGTVTNIKLVNSAFVQTNAATWSRGSSIVGTAYSGTVSNIYSDAYIYANAMYNGGIVGVKRGRGNANTALTIENCWYNGVLDLGATGTASGGILGGTIDGNKDTTTVAINNCLFTGLIKSTYTGSVAYIGGLAGYFHMVTPTVTDSVATGSLNTATNTNVGAAFGCRTYPAGAVTATDVYVATETAKNAYVNADGSQTANITSVARANFYGDLAKTNASGLDFENTWVTLTDNVPVLKIFADMTPMAPQDPPAPEVEPDTSWYNDTDTEFVIDTAEELLGLAELVNAGNNFSGKTVKLGADITVNTGDSSTWDTTAPTTVWTPIGSTTNRFSGTFDGQGKTISGLYYKNTAGNVNFGMFAVVENATIKNFTLANSAMHSTAGSGNNGILVGLAYGVTVSDVKIDSDVYASNSTYAGAVAFASGTNPVSFTKVWMAGNITNGMWTAKIGGLLGNMDDTAGLEISVNNCLFTGTVSQTHATTTAENYVGGFVGGLRSNVKVTVTDSLSAGTVTKAATSANTYAGSVIGLTSWRGADYTSFTDVYATNECYSVVTYRDPDMYTGTVTMLPKADLLGELAKTNASGLDYETVWTTVEGKTPELRPYEASTEVDPNEETTAWFDGTKTEYTISTVGELKGLVTLSKTNIFSGITIKLGADIVWNELAEGEKVSDWATTAPANTWSPIGNGDNGFAGTFDGQGHTISGLYYSGNSYAALVARLYGGTVKNVNVVDSYLESVIDGTYNSTTHFHYASAIVGRANNGATVSGIYTNAILAGGKNSGLVAFNDGGALTISNCWFDGTINAANVKNSVGGILGDVANNRTPAISDCLFTGTITGNGATYVGGLVGAGYWNTKIAASNCLVAGDMTGVTTGTVGSVIGNNPGGNASTYTNVYVTNETHTNLKGGGGATFPVTAVAAASLKGETAKTTLTGFDFEGTWTTVSGGLVPVLKGFEEYAPVDTTAETTAWYDGTKTEYTISTVGELKGLVTLSKTNTFSGITIKLGADIVWNELAEGEKVSDWATTAPANVWTPIGDQDNGFLGTFDGQGHSISGLYCVDTGYASLVARLYSPGVVKNVAVVDSYFRSNGTTKNYSGAGIVARMQNASVSGIYTNAIFEAVWDAGIVASVPSGTGTITNCWFDGTINDAERAGGILGYGCDSKVHTITNCLFTGSISGSKSSGYYGGIVGMVPYSAKANLTNCLSAGDMSGVTAGVVGSVIGNNPGGNGSVQTNVYATTETHANQMGAGGTAFTVTTVAAASLKGETAKTTLTGFDFEGTWTTVEGFVPVLKGFEAFAPVVEDTSALDISWYNDTDTTFTLTTSGQLKGLASLVNGGNNFSGKTIKLGEDITFNSGDASTWGTTAPEYEWTPIGTDTNRFKGTFDGQDHTISGLYIYNDVRGATGLFGAAERATIKNFSLVNSYFETEASDPVNGAAVMNGGVVGFVNTCVLENITCDADMVTNCQRTGGIVGRLQGGITTITNCHFSGSITGVGSDSYTHGGIVGSVQSSGNAQLNRCSFTGTIDSDNHQLGGMIGLVNTTETATLTDCMVTGTIDCNAANNQVGTHIGRVNGTATMVRCFAAGSPTYNNGASARDMGAGLGDTKVTGHGDGNCCRLDDGAKTLMETYFNQGIDLDFTTLAPFGGYWGNATFNVSTVGQLYAFNVMTHMYDYSNKTVNLTADITVNAGTAADWATTAPAYNWDPMGSETMFFKGTFNGNGNTISGIYCAHDSGNQLGLFGITDGAAVIKDFKLVNSYFENKTESNYGYNAAIVAYAGGTTTIEKVYTDAILLTVDSYAGGIVGMTAGTTVTVKECQFDGILKARCSLEDGCDATATAPGNIRYHARYVGGIIGAATAATNNVSDCVFSGRIYNEDLHAHRTGGIIGGAPNTGKSITILRCFSIGTLGTMGHTSNSYHFNMIMDCRTTGTENCLPTNVSTLCTDNYVLATPAYNENDETINSGSNITGATNAGISTIRYTEAEMIEKIAADKAAGTSNLDFETVWTYTEGALPTLTALAD